MPRLVRPSPGRTVRSTRSAPLTCQRLASRRLCRRRQPTCWDRLPASPCSHASMTARGNGRAAPRAAGPCERYRRLRRHLWEYIIRAASQADAAPRRPRPPPRHRFRRRRRRRRRRPLTPAHILEGLPWRQGGVGLHLPEALLPAHAHQSMPMVYSHLCGLFLPPILLPQEVYKNRGRWRACRCLCTARVSRCAA